MDQIILNTQINLNFFSPTKLRREFSGANKALQKNLF